VLRLTAGVFVTSTFADFLFLNAYPADSHAVHEYSDSESGSDSDVPTAQSAPASPVRHRRSGITIDLVNAATHDGAIADSGAPGDAAGARRISCKRHLR